VGIIVFSIVAIRFWDVFMNRECVMIMIFVLMILVILLLHNATLRLFPVTIPITALMRNAMSLPVIVSIVMSIVMMVMFARMILVIPMKDAFTTASPAMTKMNVPQMNVLIMWVANSTRYAVSTTTPVHGTLVTRLAVVFLLL
jgi:hypothetical protein